MPSPLSGLCSNLSSMITTRLETVTPCHSPPYRSCLFIFLHCTSLTTIWSAKYFIYLCTLCLPHQNINSIGQDFYLIGHFLCLDHFLAHSKCSINIYQMGLPWWRSGWESACHRGHGFEPWSGRIPHAAEQLGPWATVTKPARLELVLRNRRGRDSERPAHRDEEWPPLAATGESPRTETKTQHSQK